MAVPFSNTKLRVPKGFQNILEGLAREVLRSQPEDIFEFGAKYLDQLMKVREETGHDPAVHGARLEDRFYNNDSFKSPSVDPGSREQQDAAVKIQSNYRKHAAEQEVEVMREEDAAEKIQAGFRGYQDRQRFSDMKDPEKAKEEEEVDIDLDDPEVEQAAMKIQAGFKGFKARQEVKELKVESAAALGQSAEGDAEVIDIDLLDPDVEKAAVKIQSSFRRHLSKHHVDNADGNVATGDEPGTSGTQASPAPAPAQPGAAQEEEEVDIDLNDPEVAVAAEKIQMGFKKHMMKKKK